MNENNLKSPIFSRAVFESIKNSIGQLPPESGGMLGGGLDDDIITHFYFDADALCDATHYSPNVDAVNDVLESWNASGVRLRGFVHSHPPGLDRPSNGDALYVREIMAANPELSSFLITIVQPIDRGREFEMVVFQVSQDEDGIRMEQVPLEVEAGGSTRIEKISDTEPEPQPWVAGSRDAKQFTRVTEAYDLDLLDRLRIILVGTGGAAGVAEALARAGVSQFALVDHDTVQPCNLATQQYYQDDIGKPKVKCLAQRLRAIRREIVIEPIVAPLEDLDDETFRRLSTGRKFGQHTGVHARHTILIGATDSFLAQARINRLALNFGLPSVCCQQYARGLAGEITFTHPDTTPACHRCILSGRFKAYLNGGYRNAVGSVGSPISSTIRLNAITVTIILAIAHHGTNDDRWGDLLRQIGNRNLIQIRNHPLVENELGFNNFTEAFAGATAGMIFSDEAIWREQMPEHPDNGYSRPCPDCGGCGRLSDRRGVFKDTRIIIPEPETP